MKSFLMEMYAYDAVTNERIGSFSAKGNTSEPGKIVIKVPGNNGFYVDSHELIELARLAEETLNI